MFSKLYIFNFYAISAILLCAVAQPQIENNILKLIARSADFIALNPKGYKDCFNFLVWEMGEITTKYETNYQTCNKASRDKRNEVDLETLESRESLRNRTEDSCAALALCKEELKIDDEYQCFIEEGNDSIKVLRSISNDASSERSSYVERIRVIEYNEQQCTNKTKIIYEKERDDCYNHFNDCLLGREQPPTPKPTTTKPLPTPNIETTTESITTKK
ncbi:uncharacterized protein LOC124418916 [Lucilia cuprina]|uniref:uncharacterized protein LOC124418916 n=1 Tax=Lucilia cuprina TaxID=7375 RepID=UPI001F070B2A|nr:uncharacterized protein LOC124418916 [Lucilia cuprina]